MINEFMDTSRYVYNRTLEHIQKKRHKVNFESLRDLLVTLNTKKGLDEYKAYDAEIENLRDVRKGLTTDQSDERCSIEARIKEIQKQRRDAMKQHAYSTNPMITEFETRTPKDIRACAVKRCCDAVKTGFANLRNGNIKHFNMTYSKKTEQVQTIELTPKLISIKDGRIRLCPDLLTKDECYLDIHKRNRRKIKDLKIVNHVDIVRSTYGYYIHFSIPTEQETRVEPLRVVAGVDLGIRTFATVHSHSISDGSTVITEYKHRADLLKTYNKKICLLKARKERTRKKQLTKLDKKKTDLVDRLHWTFINDLLSRNDVIYWGDIKSHDMVKGSKNKFLNLAFNDMKFYQLKQRLLYKAGLRGKQVFCVPENYTTKTCSCCGLINDNVGSKEVFECSGCGLIAGRDVNAAKNMKMKGMVLL